MAARDARSEACPLAVCSEPEQPLQAQDHPNENDESGQKEFDFIERPSEDLFCPVTFELLLEPHQTQPKEPQPTTMPDKRRMVAVQVQCPHSPNGCGWTGEVDVADQRTDSCPKQPWKCQHCDFESTSEMEDEHKDQCIKYPVPCPNQCDAGPIPRCDVEKHRAECPLELVSCEFVDVGCNVRSTRQDLKQHMEESQQQHLLSATLLNLKLTREAIAEKDRQLEGKDRQLAEKDQLLVEKDRQLTEKDCQLAEKDCQLVQKDNQLVGKDRLLSERDHEIEIKDHQLAKKDEIIADKDKQLVEKYTQLAEKDKQLMKFQTEVEEYQKSFLETTKVALDRFLGISRPHRLVLLDFSKYQMKGSEGDWFSDPFYSHSCGYYIKLNVETNGSMLGSGKFMSIRLYVEESEFHDKLDWPVTFVVTLELLNQLGDHGHYLKEMEIELQSSVAEYSDSHDYILFQELHRKDEHVQYLKDDCLKFHMWVKAK